MGLRRVIELPQASIEVEERAGFLFVVESGQLRNLTELNAYTRAMDELIARTGIEKGVIDARGEVGDPPADVRGAMWDWLMASGRGFSMVAFVLPSEMAVARVNMTALSRRASIRAFDNVHEAQRWIMRSARSSASTVGLAAPATPPAKRASSNPPPEKNASQTALAPTERPPAAGPTPTPRVPSSPAVPKEMAARPGSDRGFRPPTPGGTERPEGARSKLRAPSDRAQRDSELRARDGATSSKPPRDGDEGGGSRVA